MYRGIAVAGNIVHDVNKRIPHFLERNGLIKCVGVKSSMGGACANVGRDLALLDPNLPIQAIGMVGEDAAGDEMLDNLAAFPNIDCSMIGRAGVTSFTDVLAEEDTKVRSFVYYAGANDRFDIDTVDFTRLRCDILHVGYILLLDALDAEDKQYGTRMARLLHMARERGIKTSVDVVSEAGDRYSRLVPPSLREADYCFLNEIEAGRTVGLHLRREDGSLDVGLVKEALRRLLSLGARGWVILHAPEGAFGADAHTGKIAMVPGAIAPEGFIVGTVGAGDAFCAGTLLGAYRGGDICSAMEDGVAAATASLRDETPSGAVPTLENARALLAGMTRGQL